MQTKLYLDTSVPSAPFDLTKPLRNHITTQWFLNDAKNFEIYTSNLAIQELEQWTNQSKQFGAKALLENVNTNIITILPEMQDLALQYINLGALPPTEKDDALHLACATLSGIRHFVSWDFSHIVSVNPILKIAEIHKKLNLPLLKIGTLSMFGGDAYGIFEPEKFSKEKYKIENLYLENGL